MNKLFLVGLIAAVLTSLAPAAGASGLLPGPVLLGNVKVDGTAATTGTQVEAMVGDRVIGSATTPIPGGQPGSFRIKTDSDDTLVGQTITFRVTTRQISAVTVASSTPSIIYAFARAFTGINVSGSTLLQMTTPRWGHTVTRLLDGRVLICGGAKENVALSSCELFDPKAGKFVPAVSMPGPRMLHTATLLASGPLRGQVLITGGEAGLAGPVLDTALLYDPSNGKITEVPSRMREVVYGHTATLLTTGPDQGKVLIVGGNEGGEPTGATELFDPVTLQFSPGKSGLTYSRYGHTATPLPNGDVLIDGGYQSPCCDAAVYKVSESKFVEVQNGGNQHAFGAAGVLGNGDVLIAGGGVGNDVVSPDLGAATDLYSNGTMARGRNLPKATTAAAAVSLPDGRVAIIGGGDHCSSWFVCLAQLSAIQVYDSSLGAAFVAGDLNVSRYLLQATLLDDETILVTGGQIYGPQVGNFYVATASAELIRIPASPHVLPVPTPTKTPVQLPIATPSATPRATPARGDNSQDVQEVTALIAKIQQAAQDLSHSSQNKVYGARADDFTFNQDLESWSAGQDVVYLQIFLNADPDTKLADSGWGSPGQETPMFGPLTQTAVCKFQEKYAAEILAPLGLNTCTGVFGPSTRAKANSLLVEARTKRDVEVASSSAEKERQQALISQVKSDFRALAVKLNNGVNSFSENEFVKDSVTKLFDTVSALLGLKEWVAGQVVKGSFEAAGYDCSLPKPVWLVKIADPIWYGLTCAMVEGPNP